MLDWWWCLDWNFVHKNSLPFNEVCIVGRFSMQFFVSVKILPPFQKQLCHINLSNKVFKIRSGFWMKKKKITNWSMQLVIFLKFKLYTAETELQKIIFHDESSMYWVMTFRPSITFKTAVTDKLRLLLPSVAVVTILWGVSSARFLVIFLVYLHFNVVSSLLTLLSARMVTKLIIQIIEYYHFPWILNLFFKKSDL